MGRRRGLEAMVGLKNASGGTEEPYKSRGKEKEVSEEKDDVHRDSLTERYLVSLQGFT